MSNRGARRSKQRQRSESDKNQAPARGKPESEPRRGIPPLALPLVVSVALAGFALLPRAVANPRLAVSIVVASAVLLGLWLVLWRQVRVSGRSLAYEFAPARVHWVQASMQGCVYAYWGWYWPQVYDQAPLIAAQLVFAYALDMLVSWYRRDRWVLGFGPFPIIFSTNLFLWFKDDWFFLQFLMVATGVLGKEFVRWTRDGRSTHIFNPSAFSLFLFSLVLIATGSTGITWGPEIAVAIGRPPHIYLEIFLVGLVVQALFSVTLVTVSAAAALCLLDLAYTGSTGTYFFIMTNLPVAIFLGLHLLVTDPATSPRTTLGKIVFGVLYGGASFALFGVLGSFGIPTFYDKLLCVPPLNLTVRVLDRVSRAVEAKLASLSVPTRSASRQNLAAMAVWIAIFVTMLSSGFLRKDHPGRDPEFWHRACDEGRPGGCGTWAIFEEVSCGRGGAASCLRLGDLVRDGRGVAREPLKAGKSFTKACELGLRDGCTNLAELMHGGGEQVFHSACRGGDSESCLILGEVHHLGMGVPRDDARALDLFREACADGMPRGCGRLGESYLAGEGTAQDPVKAVENLEQACSRGFAASCFTVAGVYRQGTAGRKNDDLADSRLHEACRLGMTLACAPGEQPPAPASATDAETELLLKRSG